jgi:chorismate dehydratase
VSYTVGCVPYLNAKPLVRRFHDLGQDSPVRVVYDVPSRLPALLAEGSVQAILVSSIEALRAPHRVADGVSISSQSEVLSVRLLSKVPLHQVETLALDRSSMTSNALAEIMLRTVRKEPYRTVLAQPDLEAMLAEADAGVLIGDNGMRADGRRLHDLDLGRAWYELTGLPFVWAMWMGHEGLDDALAQHLRDAAVWGVQHIDNVIPTAAAETGFSLAEADRYLRTIMDYRLDEPHKRALAEFAARLVTGGFLAKAESPDWR